MIPERLHRAAVEGIDARLDTIYRTGEIPPPAPVVTFADLVREHDTARDLIREVVRRQEAMIEAAAREALDRDCGLWIHRDDNGSLLSVTAHPDVPARTAYEVRSTHLAAGFWDRVRDRAERDTP